MTIVDVSQDSEQRRVDRGGACALPWWAYAACRGADTNLFFKPDKHEALSTSEKARRIAEAKALCRRCPVTRDCLAEAITLGDKHAIRGAHTPAERTYLRPVRQEP